MRVRIFLKKRNYGDKVLKVHSRHQEKSCLRTNEPQSQKNLYFLNELCHLEFAPEQKYMEVQSHF